MSSELTNTEAGGDSAYDQYTSQNSDLGSSDQPSKSSGQLGSSTASAPDPEASQKREAGERKAANVRYGQGISEGGMGGTTTGQSGEADGPADEEGNAGRGAQGYDQRGGGEESSETIGG